MTTDDATLMVADLQLKRLERARINHETYKMLYAKSKNKLQRVAEARGDTAWVHVAPFIVGRPIYTHSHAIRYVTEKLQTGGFRVKDYGEGWLHVEWSPGKTPPPAETRHKKAIPLSQRLARLQNKMRSI